MAIPLCIEFGAQLEARLDLSDMVQVSEYKKTGAVVYDVDLGVNETVVFAWQQTANDTAHQLFRVNSSSGAISVARSLAGQGGKQFVANIGVYYWYGEEIDHLEAVQILIFITKAVVCSPSILNITVRDNVSVGTRLVPLQCEVVDNRSIPLMYSIVSDPFWRHYFNTEDLGNSSHSILIVNSSLMTSPHGSKIELDILVTAIGASFQFNNTVRVLITVTSESSIITCINTTVAINSPAELQVPLHRLCRSTAKVGFANVTVHILLDAGLPFWLSNGILRLHPNATMKDRLYLVALNVTAVHGNVTFWSISFVTVTVIVPPPLSPHLQPSSAVVYVNENTAPPILVHSLEAVNFPSSDISFYLRSKKNPTAGK